MRRSVTTVTTITIPENELLEILRKYLGLDQDVHIELTDTEVVLSHAEVWRSDD